MKELSKSFVVMIVVLSAAALSYAQDITFEVTVDRTNIDLGSGTNLNLSFYGTQDVSAPELPDIDGFNWQYRGPSTRISIVNGKASNSITHIYRLLPLKAGVFTIPSFSLEYKGNTYTSNAIRMEVVQGPGRQGATYEEGEQDLEDRIFVVMEAEKTKAYVNEIVPVTIKLFSNELAVRDVQYPEFAHEGFSVDEYEEPKKHYVIMEGVRYDIIEFNTSVFAMRLGELTIGPAEIKCNLLVRKQARRRSFFDDDFFDGFFDRYERYPLNLKSTDIPITILDLPRENIPPDFYGAFGSYDFYLKAEPEEVKVGDPVILRMTIVGRGSPHTVKPPLLDLGDDFKVYESEVKQAKDIKTFEYVIIPKSDKISQIPEIRFSFFDTKYERYKTIARGPIPITVNPLPEGEELKIFEIPEEGTAVFRRREILGRDIIYIKDSPGRLRKRGTFLCKNKLFIAFQFLPLLAVVSVLVFQKRKERLQTDIRYARRLRAPRKARNNLVLTRKLLDSGEKDRFFESAFKTLQEYLGDKFHLPTAGITSNIVEEELRPRNIDKKVLDKIKECFTNCDTARYAPSSATQDQMTKTFRLLEDIIDNLERGRFPLTGTSSSRTRSLLSMKKNVLFFILIYALGFAGQAGADGPGQAHSLLYQGNASYSEEDYGGAISEYEKALSLRCESGPLYYNLGNAYFKAGSLGKAILNYLRAKRLMPNDADLKANLSYAQSLIKGGTIQPERKWFARVFFKLSDSFSLDGITLLCAILYFVLCGLIIGSILLGNARKILIYSGGIILGILILFTSIFIAQFDKVLVQKEAVILAGSSDAKFEPIDDATTFFILHEGERVAIITSRKGWAKVRRTDGKQGWVKARGIEPL